MMSMTWKLTERLDPIYLAVTVKRNVLSLWVIYDDDEEDEDDGGGDDDDDDDGGGGCGFGSGIYVIFILCKIQLNRIFIFLARSYFKNIGCIEFSQLYAI